LDYFFLFFLFFEQAKMDYINIVVAVSPAQGVPKKLLKKMEFVQGTKSG